MAQYSIFLVLLACVSFCAAQQSSIFPVNITQAVVRGQNAGSCPGQQMLDSQNTATRGEIERIVRDTVAPVINCPCGGPGRWTKVGDLDFSDPTVPCPAGFTLTSTPVRGCGRSSGAAPTCNQVMFPVNGQSYSRVCGRVNAYQEGSVDAFSPGQRADITVEDTYVDGASLTYGPPGSRQHIWTFAAAIFETSNGNYPAAPNCACTNINANWNLRVPSFIGNNYFCATGNTGPGWQRVVYGDDPLWDGLGCGPTNACCQLNNPPWFCTALPQPTTEDIELRVCHDQAEGDEDLLLSLVDLYIM